MEHEHEATFDGNRVPDHRHTTGSRKVLGDGGSNPVGSGWSNIDDLGTTTIGTSEAEVGIPKGTINVDENENGVDPQGANIPPYFKLIYIIKIDESI